MKLDKLRFAQLCTTIQIWLNDKKVMLSQYDIEELDRIIDIEMPEQDKVNYREVENLISYMVVGTQKIEAIKCLRNLTGLGLKEAKDAVERHWITKPADI